MDIVIAGAGIGGLALAGGLSRAGHRVRVLERASSLRTEGAAVTIFSNGFAAAAALGVPLDGLGGPVKDLAFTTSTGARLLNLDLRPLQRRTGFPVAVVPRRDLIARLAAALPENTVTFDAAVTSIAGPPRPGTDAGVRVSDGRGHAHHPDVLVGADGHASAVRRYALSPTPARSTGWATWQGLTALDHLTAQGHPTDRRTPADGLAGLAGLVAGTTGRFVIGDAGFVGLMPAGDSVLQWWFDVPHEPDAPLPASPVTWLRERFAGYAAPVRSLLGIIDDEQVGLYPHVVHEVPDVWGTDSVTLLGDAAHAFPPTQAQGANQALEDAWMLTRTLTTAPAGADVRAALRRYEATRTRRVRRVMRLAVSEMTNTPPGPLARTAARLVPPGIAGRAYVHLLRRSSSVLNDDRP